MKKVGNCDLVWLGSVYPGIKTIIDIGANDGGYRKLLRKLFYAHSVHAIEPNPSHTTKFRKRVSPSILVHWATLDLTPAHFRFQS